METHANHSHKAPGKNFLHYFFEFLMLFLAVTLGFYAENLRDHFTERSRENAFMQSMVEDLKTDTTKISEMVARNSRCFTLVDSLITLMRTPDCDRFGQTMYYYARIITTVNRRFELNDRTYEQMKSSGSLRMISDRAVSDSVLKYYSAQPNLRRQEDIQNERANSYFDFAGNVFDAAVFQEMMQVFPYGYKKPEGNPKLLTHDPAVINDFIGRLHYLGAVTAGNTSQVRLRMDQTARLIALIQKEYHLE